MTVRVGEVMAIQRDNDQRPKAMVYRLKRVGQAN